MFTFLHLLLVEWRVVWTRKVFIVEIGEHAAESYCLLLDFLFDLDKDYVEGLLCYVVMSHAKIAGPGKWLSFTRIERPEDLKLVIDRIENGFVVRVNSLFGYF